MRFAWSDGDRVRVVELASEGGGRYRASVDGVEIELEAADLGDGRLRIVTREGTVLAQITADGERRFVRFAALDFLVEPERRAGRRRGTGHGGGLEAPMPGIVTRVMIEPGEAVRKGQPLVALEAMKMEHVIRAPRDGTVASIAVGAGEMVEGGVPLVEMEES